MMQSQLDGKDDHSLHSRYMTSKQRQDGFWQVHIYHIMPSDQRTSLVRRRI
jgi:hypothetical protein